MTNLEQQLTPDPNELYLQELVIEQPKAKSELRFDPERDLTADDWEEMERTLNEKRASSWWWFIERAMSMKLLGASPEQLNLDDVAWKGMEQALNGNWDFDRAMEMKLLGASPDQLGLNDAAWKGMEQRLNEKRTSKNWEGFAIQAMSMKLLGASPDQLGLNDAAWKGMEQKLNGKREGKGNWFWFAIQAMSMKLLGASPEQLNLNDAAWKGMEQKLNEWRTKKNGLNFAEQAMRMTILAAYKAEIVDGDIKITKYPPATEGFSSNVPLPPQRKF